MSASPAPAPGPAAIHAERAALAYAAMQRRFCVRGGRYRRDGWLRWSRASAHLWPFARAFAATLDLAGIPVAVRDRAGIDVDLDGAIAQRLHALERYWDPPAYASDVRGTRTGGDRYHDDNAWVGLALVQLERLRPGAGPPRRAAELFAFACAGWDERDDAPGPGGVFWVEQGIGVGRRNHDRNTVSTAPNAELGLQLALLGGEDAGAAGPRRAREMIEWVNATLDAGHGEDPATGLFWDKVRGDGTIDRALWSYNQGSMVGADVLLHRLAGPERHTPYLARAEAIARRALEHYRDRADEQPPAFHAIFFRNLLLLHAATADEDLRAQILADLGAYADRLWAAHHRGRRAGATLLDHSALVQILALLAWDPADYARLA